MLTRKIKLLLWRHMPGLTKESLKSYGAVAAWIWRDALLRYKKPIAKTVMASGAGLLCQLAALGIVFAYAKALESDKTITLLGYVFSARSSVTLLIAAALSGFLLLVMFAILDYVSTIDSIKLRRRYEEFCSKRVYVLTSRLPHPSSPKANRMLAEETLGNGVRKDARYCGRLLKFLLNAILPLGSIVVYTIALFYISVLFSSIIFLLLSISLIFLYKINTAAAQTSHLTERHASTASSEGRRLLRRTSESAAPINYTDKAMTYIFSDGAVGRYLDIFFSRFVIKGKSRLTINILTAFSMLSVILFAGTVLILGKWSWSIFIAYLVVLRYFLTSLGKIGSIMTQTSRIYPQIRRYYEFVSDAEKVTTEASVLSDGSTISLSIPSLVNEQEKVVLQTGKPTFLIHPGSVDRSLVSQLQIQTIQDLDKGSVLYWFIGNADCLGSSLREFQGFPSTLTDIELRYELATLLDGKNGKEILPVSLDDILTEECFAAISPDVMQALSILSAIYSKRHAIVLREKDLTVLPDHSPSGLPYALSNRVVIVAINSMPTMVDMDDDTIVLVSNGKQLVYWCTIGWLAKNPYALNQLTTKMVQKYDALDEWADDEDEDEDF